MKNFITIDLEDYYQVTGFSDVVRYDRWGTYESRVERNTNIVLEALGDNKATFFILGWEAEKRPGLIKKIAGAGHEIATHGRRHKLITNMNKEEFAEDMKREVKLLEDLTGEKVLGHRAPSFSITDDTPWAFEVMADLGLKYDSSVFPIKRRHGGIPEAGMKPFSIETSAGVIYEFPLAVTNFLGKTLPVAGGGFFRLYPYWFTRRAMLENNRSDIPVVVYLHPWEFDPGQPRLKSFFSRNGFNHYVNLDKTLKKFRKLLIDFEFTPIRNYFDENN